MDANQYLEAVLRDQTLVPQGAEMAELQAQRAAVEKILRDAFGDTPRILEAGSKAKKTMIRASYDLDVVCYFPENESCAGNTLKEIYDRVASLLADHYVLQKKTSALRLQARDQTDLHVDVVPGRYVNGDTGDVYLHQQSSDKDWLKTNIEVHISNVRDSDVREAVKLFKLWNAQQRLGVKTFVLELLVIKLLKEHVNADLASQFEHVALEFRDRSQLSVEDPANPYGNDLSECINSVREGLRSAATDAVTAISAGQWENIFGPTSALEQADRIARLSQASARLPVTSRPWLEGD